MSRGTKLSRAGSIGRRRLLPGDVARVAEVPALVITAVMDPDMDEHRFVVLCRGLPWSSDAGQWRLLTLRRSSIKAIPIRSVHAA